MRRLGESAGKKSRKSLLKMVSQARVIQLPPVKCHTSIRCS